MRIEHADDLMMMIDSIGRLTRLSRGVESSESFSNLKGSATGPVEAVLIPT